MTASITNTGTTTLRDINFAMDGGHNLTVVQGDGLQRRIERLDAGKSEELTVRFVSRFHGERRVTASAHDGKGWAGAGAYLDVLVEDE